MKEVAILGNGISRFNFKKEISEFKEVWVCNKAVYEIAEIPNIKRVYSVHLDLLKFISREPFIKENNIILVGPEETKFCISFKEKIGWSSGNLAILDALLEGYNKIHLFGFDFGGRDLYQDHVLIGNNFKKQYEQILKREDLDAENKLILYQSDKKVVLPKPVKEKSKIPVVDLGYKLVSHEGLEKIIKRLSFTGGIIQGRDASFHMRTTCGRLIRKLNRRPEIIKEDNFWSFEIRKGEFPLKFPDYQKEHLEFLNLVKDKRIIFVGPSPKLLNQNKGEFIDSFDLIVRTNNMFNTLLDNSKLYKDFGKRCDILYTNVTYERDSFKDWKLEDWISNGLRFLVKKSRKELLTDETISWRRSLLNLNIDKGEEYSLGVLLINDLLQFPIESLHVLGIDGYKDIPEEVQKTNEEYIEGYLPKYWIEKRKNIIGKKVSPHDKYLDSKTILEMANDDPRLILDEEVRESLKVVAYGK